MAQQCDECGTFMQRTYLSDGSKGWICKPCARDEESAISDESIVGTITDTLESLGIGARDDIAYFAYGLADAISMTGAVSGISPRVAGASCVYLGSILADDKFSQPTITDAADVSGMAIRNNYRDLYEASGYNDEFGTIRQGERENRTINSHIDLDGWRSYLEERRGSTAVKAAVSNVRRFAYWYDGESPPDANDVDAWLETLAEEGFAPDTIDGRYKSLRRFFEWAGLGELDGGVDIQAHKKTAWANVEA